MQNFRQQLFDIPESHFPAFYEHDWDRPGAQDRPSHAKKERHSTSNAEVMYRLQGTALTQARKPYRTVLLVTYDGRVISAQFLWRSTSHLKVDRHIIWYSFLCHSIAQSEKKGVRAIPNSFSYCHEELSGIQNLHRLSFCLINTLLNSAFLRHMYT